MLVLNRMDPRAGLRVVEDPREAVQRLSRVEADDAELMVGLGQMAAGDLRRLGRLANRAADLQAGGSDGDKPARPQPAPVIRRAAEIGD